jgi:hypothetical protein
MINKTQPIIVHEEVETPNQVSKDDENVYNGSASVDSNMVSPSPLKIRKARDVGKGYSSLSKKKRTDMV